MNSLKSCRILSLGLLIAAMIAGSTPAFSQNTQSAGLKNELYKIENRAFSGNEVTEDARTEMTGLINKASEAYDKQHTQDVHDTIVANFQKLVDAIAPPRRYLERRGPGMILLIPFHTSKPLRITIDTIKTALKKLCPLFPFC